MLVEKARSPFLWFNKKRSSQTDDEKKIWVLKDVSFEVSPGEIIGVIGRNGAGKSTLLKILSRITDPSKGRAEVCGRVASLLEVGTGFHPELTGRENVYLNGAILGMRKAEIDCKFDEIIAFSEIENFIDTPVKRYSSGMYLRLAFAVAAHLEPEILLVDEVLAVGDAAFQKKCLGKMDQISQKGRTILFVSHNMQAVAALCSKTILMDGGRIVSQGSSQKVISDYLEVISIAKPDCEHFQSEDERLAFEYAEPTKIIFNSNEDKQFQFRIRRRVNGSEMLYLSAHLIGEEGEIITQCDSRLIDYWLPNKEMITGCFQIRYLWLRPGNYFIEMFICSPGKILARSACGFKISQLLPYRSLASEDAAAKGRVFSDFEWKS